MCVDLMQTLYLHIYLWRVRDWEKTILDTMTWDLHKPSPQGLLVWAQWTDNSRPHTFFLATVLMAIQSQLYSIIEQHRSALGFLAKYFKVFNVAFFLHVRQEQMGECRHRENCWNPKPEHFNPHWKEAPELGLGAAHAAVWSMAWGGGQQPLCRPHYDHCVISATTLTNDFRRTFPTIKENLWPKKSNGFTIQTLQGSHDAELRSKRSETASYLSLSTNFFTSRGMSFGVCKMF